MAEYKAFKREIEELRRGGMMRSATAQAVQGGEPIGVVKRS
jgi:hypothetical protein